MGCKCENDVTVDLTMLQALLETENNHGNSGSLITVLQKAQSIYGYLPRAALEQIARTMGVPLAKVIGVASFYSQFRMSPVGKYTILLCKGTACHVNGAEAIATAISEALGITDGQTTSDGLFTLTEVACLGCCSLSPVMMINGEPYGLLTPDTARRIITDLRDKP